MSIGSADDNVSILTNDDDLSVVEPMVPSEVEVEHSAPDTNEVEDVLPLNKFELFSSKNKVEIESQLPLSKLINSINQSWHDDATVSTANSTTVDSISNWHCYQVDEEPAISIPTPKRQRPNLVPASFLIANKIGGQVSNTLMRALFDSGSASCLIHKSAIPAGVRLEQLSHPQKLLTIAGQYTSMYRVPLEDIRLPEFDRHR